MKRPAAILITGTIITAVFLVCNLSFGETGQKNNMAFDSNLRYDVYYVVSEFEVDVLREVSIEGAANMGQREYLVIRGPRVRSAPSVINTDGYILIDSVKSILPSVIAKPEKQFRKD
jgi:hypothetical protein